MPKYSFKSNLFFSIWGWSEYFGLFQWEKIIFCQNSYFCLKMIFRPCYFYFFFHTRRFGWVGFGNYGKNFDWGTKITM